MDAPVNHTPNLQHDINFLQKMLVVVRVLEIAYFHTENKIAHERRVILIFLPQLLNFKPILEHIRM